MAKHLLRARARARARVRARVRARARARVRVREGRRVGEEHQWLSARLVMPAAWWSSLAGRATSSPKAAWSQVVGLGLGLGLA